MTSWFKYTYVCPTCDALIEITRTGLYIPQRCCGTDATYLSVVDVTIPSTTTKEEPMEYPYNNPDETAQALALQELIQKKDAIIVRLQDEVSSLSQKLGADHKNCDYWKSENGRIGSQLIELINAAYDEDTDASEILEAVCEIIDYSPVKTVQFEGVIHFSGSMDVHRSELDSFDLTSALEDVYVDINNGDVVIDNYELYSVEEPY